MPNLSVAYFRGAVNTNPGDKHGCLSPGDDRSISRRPAGYSPAFMDSTISIFRILRPITRFTRIENTMVIAAAST